MTRVLVTGASGYLAMHVVKQLLDSGEYIVRGTVRSLANEQKVEPLRSLCPENAKYELELAEADLTKKESWNDAVKDCTYVIHVASPFPAENPRDEMEVIGPAVEGTKNVLEACAKTKGGVKRVVLTSSCAAIYSGRVGEDIVFTEEDWASEEKSVPYEKSKRRAELAAWELVKGLPDDEKFELCTINPGLILGPVLHGSKCTSMEFHRRFLQREMPMVPKLSMPVTDVRDVAGAHITAMTSPKAPGYNVPTTQAPSFGLKILSCFDASLKMLLPSLGHEVKFDNSKIKDHLGYQPTELKSSVIDMAYNLIDAGFIKKTPQYEEMKKQKSASGSQ
ncbi:putative uncharacterized oxidoreductase YDR541C isoform X2 [Orbicella faveolata]|uniref:putative uncharacterized oxidoreductase YDR541C isoform X2 n=1 Tax=Orbicella faveolata TaxID=48498 RepID=UPI0009E19845|nr:putative uncharacterized oxidoreductase YDR541C isoform X2 [Orbicella faveolata]